MYDDLMFALSPNVQLTTCLEMSGMLTAAMEMSGILLKVKEVSGKKSRLGKLAKNCLLLVAYLCPYRYLVSSS